MNKRAMKSNIKHKCLLTEEWGSVGNVGYFDKLSNKRKKGHEISWPYNGFPINPTFPKSYNLQFIVLLVFVVNELGSSTLISIPFSFFPLRPQLLSVFSLRFPLIKRISYLPK